MKTVGLIGGMSWESSAEYYRLLNEFVRERMGGLHSARCLLYSVDFAEIEQLQATGAWKEAGTFSWLLASPWRRREPTSSALHQHHAQSGRGMEAAVSIPLLHIADVVAEAISAAGIARVGLLGTAFTMEQSFYKDRLARHGLRSSSPPPSTA